MHKRIKRMCTWEMAFVCLGSSRLSVRYSRHSHEQPYEEVVWVYNMPALRSVVSIGRDNLTASYLRITIKRRNSRMRRMRRMSSTARRWHDDGTVDESCGVECGANGNNERRRGPCSGAAPPLRLMARNKRASSAQACSVRVPAC